MNEEKTPSVAKEVRNYSLPENKGLLLRSQPVTADCTLTQAGELKQHAYAAGFRPESRNKPTPRREQVRACGTHRWASQAHTRRSLVTIRQAKQARHESPVWRGSFHVRLPKIGRPTARLAGRTQCSERRRAQGPAQVRGSGSR